MPSIAKTTGTLGAEVHGLVLAPGLAEDEIAWISDALVENKVLFFRGQSLDRQSHIAFARRFGSLEVHPFTTGGAFDTSKEDPEVIVIESKPGKRLAGTDQWHSDVTWRLTPSLGSILRCIESPQAGGDTLWADMELAYELLDDETKARIDGLEAEHDWHKFRMGLRMNNVEERVIARLETQFPPAIHPVVRTHPVSGRRSLYVNTIFTRRIFGLGESESDSLLERLYRQASIPEVQVRFRWEPGSVAFWDNRSTQHYAVGDYGDDRRLMERVTVVGDAPF